MAFVSVPRTLYSRAVLLDTGALVALAETADCWHEAATGCLRRMIDLRLPAIVSVPTIHETHRRLLYSPQPTLARSFLAGIYDGSVNIVVTNPVDEYEATKLIDRYAGVALTLTDATNMALMVRLQIGAAFSFDRHFLQAGFVRVPPLHL